MAEVTIEQALRIGFDHQQAGRLAQAEQVYRLILDRQPNNPEATHLLGFIFVQTGRLNEGISVFQRAIEINPTVPDFHSNLGNAMRIAGRIGESISACRRAIELKPDLAEAHNNLGISLRENKQLDESIQEYRTAIGLRPGFAEAFNNLGHSLSLAKRFDEAIVAYEESLRLQPNLLEAANNLATTLADVGRIEEAIALLRRVMQMDGRFADAYSNLGLLLATLGRTEEALVMSRRAVALVPNHAGYHWNLALDLLSQGMYAEGWREFEWRWLWKDFPTPRRAFAEPIWRGEDLNGRTILLHAEQGLGDSIQFARYAPMVAQRGGEVLLNCARELAALFRSNPDLGQVIEGAEPRPSFDFHCPLLTLPLVFRTELKSIPASVPYLKPDPQVVAKWKTRLESVADKRKIGLVWAGSPTHPKDWQRSMNLASFLPLTQIPGIALVSLQKGPAADQTKQLGSWPELIDFTSELDNFAETAGLVANLDLVIGVDTSVIHLAGAMGKPVWVLIGRVFDWRWLREREDSPWYPTARIFRQKSFGDWNEVVERVAAAVLDEIGAR
jgi:tetratricopeptide (TPR) repeat protein